jgi:hypothetical protein
MIPYNPYLFEMIPKTVHNLLRWYLKTVHNNFLRWYLTIAHNKFIEMLNFGDGTLKESTIFFLVISNPQLHKHYTVQPHRTDTSHKEQGLSADINSCSSKQ